MGVTIGVRADPKTKKQDRGSCDSQIVKTRSETEAERGEKFRGLLLAQVGRGRWIYDRPFGSTWA